MADAAGARWAKLLGARAEAHARLRLGELQRLLAVCAEFTRACEALGARPLVGLRTALAVWQCPSWTGARVGLLRCECFSSCTFDYEVVAHWAHISGNFSTFPSQGQHHAAHNHGTYRM